MIEPRRELGFAQEPLQQDLVAAQPAVQDLDDDLAAQQLLVAAIHVAEAAFGNSLAQEE